METKDLQSEADFRAYQGLTLAFHCQKATLLGVHPTAQDTNDCLGSLILFIKLVFHHSLYYLNFPVLVMYKDNVLFGAKPLIKQNRKC